MHSFKRPYIVKTKIIYYSNGEAYCIGNVFIQFDFFFANPGYKKIYTHT